MAKIKYYLILIAFSIIIVGCSGEKDAKKDAWICAQKVVNDELKSPSSAKFCSYSEASITDMGNNQYNIRGTVEAENSFGAKVKTTFRVTLTLTSSGFKDYSVKFE